MSSGCIVASQHHVADRGGMHTAIVRRHVQFVDPFQIADGAVDHEAVLRYGEDAIYEKVSSIILRFIDCKFVIVRLYRASVDGASVDLEAVPISVESLDPRFVFLLDAGDVIWIWSGAKSRVLNSFLIHKKNANLRLLWQIKYDYLP